MENVLALGLAIIVGLILGILFERSKQKQKSIGNLLVMDDPDDGHQYLFLELTKGDVAQIRNRDVVHLTVRSGKRTQE